MPEPEVIPAPVVDASPLSLTPAELDKIIVGEIETPKDALPPDEPKFTDIDPAKLPDDLKATHKSMQGDYTRKTQEIAQQRRELEEQRKALEAQRNESKGEWERTLEDIRTENERIKQELESIKNGRGQEHAEELEPWQVELRKKDEQLAALERRFEHTDLQRKIANAEEVFETLKSEDEVFKGYEGEILKILAGNKSLQQAARENPEGVFDQIYGHLTRRDRKTLDEGVRKAERERVYVEIKERAQKATSSRTSLSGGSSVTQPVGSMSVEEAYEAAKRQHAVA